MEERWPTELFKDRAAEFLKLYPGDTDEQAVRSAIDYGSDAFIAFGTWKWLEAHRKTGRSPVYRYHFELAAPPSKFHPGTFAFHSDDIEYVFGTLDTRPGWNVASRGSQVERRDDELLDQLRQDRRSERGGPAVLAEVDADDALIHLNDPSPRDPTRCGRATIPAEGNAADAVPIANQACKRGHSVGAALCIAFKEFGAKLSVSGPCLRQRRSRQPARPEWMRSGGGR